MEGQTGSGFFHPSQELTSPLLASGNNTGLDLGCQDLHVPSIHQDW